MVRLIVLSILLAFLPNTAFAQENVQLKMSDETTLEAKWWPGDSKVAALFLHECGNEIDQNGWSNLATKTNALGPSVMTVNFRPFGSSLEGTATAYRVDTKSILSHLKNRLDTDATIVVMGASCGAAMAMMTGATDKDVRGVVLLSPPPPFLPWFNYKDWFAMADNEAAPIWSISSSGDELSVKTARDAFEISSSPQSLITIVAGKSHGVALFDEFPELEDSIASWIANPARGRSSE